jgi:hypothetical protein
MLNVDPTFAYLLRRTAMSTLAIKDMLVTQELDHEQMGKVVGGSLASRLDNPVFITWKDAMINAGAWPEEEEDTQ